MICFTHLAPRVGLGLYSECSSELLVSTRICTALVVGESLGLIALIVGRERRPFLLLTYAFAVLCPTFTARDSYINIPFPRPFHHSFPLDNHRPGICWHRRICLMDREV